MPLDRSGTKKSVSNNIRTEMHAHPEMKQKQAIAIALDVARRAKRASGGNIAQTPWYQRVLARSMTHDSPAVPPPPKLPMLQNASLPSTPLGKAVGSPKLGAVKPQFPKVNLNPPKLGKMKSGGEVKSRTEPFSEGPIVGTSMGRADHVNTKVKNNSFIIPSHVVSMLGQGNSLAGMAKLHQMFPSGDTTPNSHKPSSARKMAKGGKTHDHVDVALSDGEFSVDPKHVLRVGHCDYAAGHRILKEFCKHITHKAVEQLKHMPEPVDDGDE